MKHNWEYKRLGEVCKLSAGGDKPNDTVKEKTADCVIPIFSNGIEDEGLYGYCKEPKVFSPAVTISGRGTLGVPFIRQEPFVPIIRLIVAVPTNKLGINFLYYWILNRKFSGNGGTIPQLTVPMIKGESIPVPPLAEQERIVAELDALNSTIAKCRELFTTLDALAQSLFYDTFGDPVTNPKGWEMEPLKDLSKSKLSYGSGASSITYDNEIRYIRITDIDDYGNLKQEIAASPSKFDTKYLLSDGDILFARSGATVGKSFHYKKSIGKAIYAGYLIKASPNTNIISPIFLYALTKTKYYKDYIAKSIRGAAQPNVNAQIYGAFHIPVPPLPLQEDFARKIEAIEAEKKKVEATMAEVQTLLDSRMEYWFN